MHMPPQFRCSRCPASVRSLSLLAVAVATVLLTGCPRQRPAAPEIAYGVIPTTDSAGGKLDRFLVPGADADRDGVTDDRERAMRSDPDDPDTDKDGFPDGFEDRFADFGFRITAVDADSDGDGLTDAYEKALDSDPANADTDGDGYSDFDEELNRHYGFDPLLKTVDTDFDGLSDALEARIGSSPTKVDSNDDGVSDFQAYAADQPPNGEPLTHGLGELIGTTYSEAMADALTQIRDGGAFPAALAEQLPYPDVTARITTGAIRPSAALMQRSLYNPHNSPGLYPTYAEFEQELFKLADHYDGNPGPRLVRLFYWTGQTQDTCAGGESKGRRIYALKVSLNPDDNKPDPEIAFLGVHHARELITGTHTMTLLHTLTDNYASDGDIRKLVDTREIWVIPVVNPNGYDRAVSNQISWRKNARLERGQSADTCGSDVNRNYGFEHVVNFPPAQRKTLPSAWANGVNTSTGDLIPTSGQYPGPKPFSEVETQAVRGLAHNQFLTRNKVEVDGLVCALSWHSYGGVVGHPMSHAAMPPDTGLDPAHAGPFGELTKDMATASGYGDIKDGFRNLTSFPDGCSFQGYSVYGDANDWMYKDKGTYSVLIESYSAPERGGCAPSSVAQAFNPQDAATRDMVARNNVQAALAMLRRCPF